MKDEVLTMQRKWWHDKVAYQIYPKSFYDSNGDGIGDIPGIIAKLDYLADLGIDLIWLSPVYLSPLADQGYDIADYYQIDPRFGTMEDMDRLIAEGQKRGIRILMDLVVNHCSDEHEWFQRAIADPDGKYGQYFYLLDAAASSELPCNWRSYFGGPVWAALPPAESSAYFQPSDNPESASHGAATANKLYLHLFHRKQPDLNWENPDVRADIYKNINWWLDKGLAGFRIDAIINIKKALPFRDYPADRPDGLSSVWHMLQDAEGVGEFLGEMRDKTFARYDAFTVGEVFHVKPEELQDFIGDNGYFSTMFDFSTTCFGKSDLGWYDCRQITAEDYKETVFASQEKLGSIGFPANIIENHDEPRGVSHYLPEDGQNDDGKKMLATLNLMVRGLPFLYQGQELGMENTVFSSIDEIDDISSHGEYQSALRAGVSEEEAFRAVAHYSRDNARTPVQWNDSPNAGFTTGTPWLSVNPNYTRINAEAQMHDENSVFSWYKKLIALRKNSKYKEVIVYGELIPYRREQQNLMAFFRKPVEDAVSPASVPTLLVLANYQSGPQEVPLPGHAFRVVLNSKPLLRVLHSADSVAEKAEGACAQEASAIRMDGYQAVILELL